MKFKVGKKVKKDKKELLREELKRLYICEAMAIPNFWFAYFALWLLVVQAGENFIHTPIVLYPLSLLSFILVEGSVYWYICLRRVDNKYTPNNVAFIYSKLKVFNWVLILLYIPIFLMYKSSTTHNMIGLFIYIFSILEHINYFYIRLSYKNPLQFFVNLKRLKFPKSQIVKEIERSLCIKNNKTTNI